MERVVSIESHEAHTAPPVRSYGGFSISRSVEGAGPAPETRGQEMTRDEAYASCPDDSYVELYGHQWLIVPFAPVEQPEFFVCTPGLVSAS
jgi:hypothetical protein